MKKTFAIILTVAACVCMAEPRPRTSGPINPGVNTNYGRLNGDVAVYAPKFLNLGNIVGDQAFPYPVWTAHGKEADYRAQNWKPIDWTVEQRDGYTARLTGKFEPGTNDNIKASVAYDPVPEPPPPPPRNLQLSKMKLKANMRTLGIWSNVWEMVSSDPDLLSDWQDSVVFDERNEFVQNAFAALESAGLTAELKEWVVTNSVTEIEVRQ